MQGHEVCFVTMTGATTGRTITKPLMHVPHDDGVLLVDKPAGPTSHDIVGRIRRELPFLSFAPILAVSAKTGQRVAYHDLGSLFAGGHFANDLALDAQGNVYVTDSFSPVIYRVDTAGKATVFAQSELFTGENFNLNGIVVHPDGYLLVNKHNSGELFRVSLKDPARIARVQLPEALRGADGMVLRTPGRLTLVQNSGADRTLDLVSTDGWKTATITRTQKSLQTFPTTAAKVGKDVYVMNSRLDTLLTPDAPKVSDFILQKY